MNSIIFNFAQSFFVDPSSVQGAKTVDVSSVDLYFKSKPTATGNRSGINNPGVFIFLCEVNANKVPNIIPFINGTHFVESRVPYVNILPSSDSSVATKFKFETSVKIKTGIEYAIVGIYDGNESFVLWNSKQGDWLVGTNKPSPGPSGKYVGSYYDSLIITKQTSPNNPNMTLPLEVIPSWKPSSTIDLKFNVNLARYSVGGVPVGNNTIQANLPVSAITYSSSLGRADEIAHNANSVTFKVSPAPYEYITYDRKTSRISNNVLGGEYVYQNTVFYPGGTGSAGVQTGITVATIRGNNYITANSLYPNGAAFNWSDVYGTSLDNEYIVTISLNGGTGRKTDIRKVVSQISNTVIQVDTACGFTNSAAYFIKSPVARIDHLDSVKTFNIKASSVGGRRTLADRDLIVLKDSNANSTVRFVNNSINSISISAAGTNYTNSDYILVSGFENSADVAGGYSAKANIVANVSTGAIEQVYLSNVGAGFSNTSNISFTITRASGTTVGTSANFTFTTGTVIRSEYDGRGNLDDSTWGLGGVFNDCNIINLEFYDVNPTSMLKTESSSVYSMTFSTPYYAFFSDYTYSGVAYKASTNANITTSTVTNLSNNKIESKNTPILASKSNEYAIIDDGTGVPAINPISGSGYVTITTASNNDFVGVSVQDFKTSFSKYNINSDYTNEHTDYGNAAAKHITKKINFAQDKSAEDLLVYLKAYRPLNTDIKVYARIQNTNDVEAFDDKNWTMLELLSPNVYSSSSSTENFIEMEYGFYNSPNVAYVYTGSVTIDNVTTMNVTGSGTTFSSNLTSNVQINDLVKIYSPLFPNSYAISVVSAVANDTQITLNSPLASAGLVGSGFRIALVGRVGNSTYNAVGYPLQAFNNKNNSNVVRYYSSSMMEYDTYDTLQLKIVFLADVGLVGSSTANLIPTSIPRIDDIRAIGVSA